MSRFQADDELEDERADEFWGNVRAAREADDLSEDLRAGELLGALGGGGR